MITKHRYAWAAALLILALSFSACAHRATPTLTTAEQRIAQSNAAIAAANRSLTESVIASQRSGLLSVEQTGEVLVWTERVALANKGIAQILSSADLWPARALKIRDLAAQFAPPAWIDRYASSERTQAIVTAAQVIVSLVKLIAQEATAAAAQPQAEVRYASAGAGAVLLMILQLLQLLLQVLPSAATAVTRIKDILQTDPATSDAMAAINAGAVADADATQSMIATWRKEHGL